MGPAAGLAGGVDDQGDRALLGLLAGGRPGTRHTAGPCGRRRRVDRLARPRRARSRAPPNRSRLRASRPRARRRRGGGNSSTPESSRKHLKPKTPASCSGRRSARLPGTAPPQKPTSTKAWPAGAPPAWPRSAATVVVGGMLLSGMSTIVVTPPAAAARVALAKPSHSVRPGSLTCTWVSTRPGQQHLVVAEARSPRPRGRRRRSYGTTATIRPPLMPTAAGPSPPA